MTKYILLALCIASAMADYKWSNLVESKVYTTGKTLKFERNQKKLKLAKNTKLKLLNIKPLDLVNIYMAEFKILDCENADFSSEMILVDVNQRGFQKVSVGLDVVKNCVLEAFIEKSDINSTSFLK